MIFFMKVRNLLLNYLKKNYLIFLSNIKLKLNEIKLKLGVRRYKVNLFNFQKVIYDK